MFHAHNMQQVLMGTKRFKYDINCNQLKLVKQGKETFIIPGFGQRLRLSWIGKQNNKHARVMYFIGSVYMSNTWRVSMSSRDVYMYTMWKWNSLSIIHCTWNLTFPWLFSTYLTKGGGKCQMCMIIWLYRNRQQNVKIHATERMCSKLTTCICNFTS